MFARKMQIVFKNKKYDQNTIFFTKIATAAGGHYMTNYQQRNPVFHAFNRIQKYVVMRGHNYDVIEARGNHIIYRIIKRKRSTKYRVQCHVLPTNMINSGIEVQLNVRSNV